MSMKKKFVLVMVILILLLSVVGLSACDFLLKNSNTTPDNKNSNNQQEQPNNNGNGADDLLDDISVEGKIFTYYFSRFDYSLLIYPGDANLSKDFLPTEEDICAIQNYIDEVDREYTGVCLAFGKNNIMKKIKVDAKGEMVGEIESYYYYQDSSTVMIFDIQGDTVIPAMFCTANSDTLLMESVLFADEDYPVQVVVYMQFVTVG